MIRKLAIALSLLGACLTGFVHALGLGEVTVKSALNQPLNAEIELVNTAGLTINEILPGLATREEFQKANVDRVYFLSDMRFEVTSNAQGKAVIVLTSKKPVREPFLNFIVELIWPSGRLLREYALLIDPPLFSDQPVAQTSPTSSSNRPTSGDNLTISSVNDDASAPSKRSILAPSSKISSGSYGPTNANDTLWDIAIQARPDRSVSPQQVMLAIQDLNPNAFIDNNINKLKAGQVLRLPSVDQIKQRSQHQAIQNVIAQNEALSGKRTQSVAKGSDSPDTQQKPSMPVLKSSGDELKLVVADSNSDLTSGSANSGQSSTSNGSDTALSVALEKLDKASIENTELNGRLTDLEEQLSTLQRLLTLKNDQLASIQSQMRANELDKSQAAGGNLNAEAPLDTASSEESGVDSISGIEGEEKTGAESEVSSVVSEDTNKSMVASEESVSMASPEAIEENVDVSTDEALPKPVVSKSEITNSSTQNNAPASQNVIEIILNNPLYLSISIASILILVILLWLISRHNAKREEEFQAQNYLSDNEELDDVNVFDEDTNEELDEVSDGLEDENETLLDLDGLDGESDKERQDESQDVIAEANAYISYGRLDQAATILEKAISQDPVRTDYRLALLGVYKDLGDRQAFDRQFSELEAIQDEESLAEAEKIRNNLQEEESLAFDSDDLGYDRASDESSNKDNQGRQQSTAKDTNDEEDSLEEDLKSFDFDSVSLDEEAEDLDLTSELDLDSLNVDESVSKSESIADLIENDLTDSSDESLELSEDLSLHTEDLDLETADLEDVSLELDDDQPEDFDDSILDVDLEDLDLNAELDQESEIAISEDFSSSKDKFSVDSDDLVVSDDVLEEAAQAFESEESSLDDDLSDADEFDFLNGTDEASTKLDLARAYIDMGDIEGAKDILLEVTKEGSESQQAEAKDLLDSID